MTSAKAFTKMGSGSPLARSANEFDCRLIRASHAAGAPRPGPVATDRAGGVTGWPEQAHAAASGLTIREALTFGAWSAMGHIIALISNGSV